MPRTTAPARPFGRVLTAMVTPLTADGALDLDARRALATHLVDHGHDGLVLSGTTGESPTTTDAEKDRAGRAPSSRRSATGPGSSPAPAPTTPPTRSSWPRRPPKAGAHGLLVVTPVLQQAAAGRRCVAHFTAVADATDLPVMLYDIPGRTGVPIAHETIAALAEHDRIVAVKDAKGDLYAGAG